MGSDNFHDKLFRTVFGRAEVARAHFEALLPASLIAAIDWDTLELRPESYISPELLHTQSDVLYRVRLDTNAEVFLYLLLEHQRKRDYAMAFRLLSYMVRIWERWIRDNGTPTKQRPLPFVVPMVLYNGTRRWPVSTRFQDLMPAQMRALLLPHIPDFGYQILDLNQTPDDTFRGHALREMTLLLLKWGHQETFWAHFPAWLDTFRTIHDSDGNKGDVVTAILRYITSVVRTAPPEEVITLLHERVSNETGGVIVTWAEQLRREGIEQGIEQGIEMERQAALGRQRSQLLRLLALKFQRVPEDTAARVAQADGEALYRWTERLLLADTLEGVFREA